MSEIKDIDAIDFSKWTEKGWWTSQEAFCVLMGSPPQAVHQEVNMAQLKNSERGHYLIDLIAAAEIDHSVEGLIFAKPFYFYRASCKAWLEWALTKPSIEIIPELLQAVGINRDRVSRSQESYRPEEEKLIKTSFLATAKIVLYLCSRARLKNIKEVVIEANVLASLPSDRTLRKWIAQEGIVLNDTKISDLEIAEIEGKLQPLIQSSKDHNAFKTTLKS